MRKVRGIDVNVFAAPLAEVFIARLPMGDVTFDNDRNEKNTVLRAYVVEVSGSLKAILKLTVPAQIPTPGAVCATSTVTI